MCIFFHDRLGKYFPNLLQIGHYCHSNWERTCRLGTFPICKITRSQSAKANWETFPICKSKLGNVPNLQDETFPICASKLGNVPNLHKQIGNVSFCKLGTFPWESKFNIVTRKGEYFNIFYFNTIMRMRFVFAFFCQFLLVSRLLMSCVGSKGCKSIFHKRILFSPCNNAPVC